jgi:hypothetical protein
MNLPARRLLFKANASKDFLTSVTCSVKARRVGGEAVKPRLPWALVFSFARVIQQPALEIWHGQDAHVLPAASGT